MKENYLIEDIVLIDTQPTIFQNNMEFWAHKTRASDGNHQTTSQITQCWHLDS